MKEHALPALPVLPVTKTNHAREREGQSLDSSKKKGESLSPLLIRSTQKRGKFKSIRKVYCYKWAGLKYTEEKIRKVYCRKWVGFKYTE